MKPKRKSAVPSLISVLAMRNQLGKIIDDAAKKGAFFVVEKRGEPKAVVMSLKEYIRLAAPEPEILKLMGEDSQKQGKDKLSMAEIDAEIKAARKTVKRDASASARN